MGAARVITLTDPADESRFTFGPSVPLMSKWDGEQFTLVPESPRHRLARELSEELRTIGAIPRRPSVTVTAVDVDRGTITVGR